LVVEMSPLSVGVQITSWATDETFQQPTRPAEDIKVLTKHLHELS